MSFMSYSKNNPEFLNNFLYYQAFITFSSEYTVDEIYFDIRTFFKYLIFKEKNEDFDINVFRKYEIKDISIEDLKQVTSKTITDYLFFLKYELNNVPKTRNRKLYSIKKLYKYLCNQNLIVYNPTNNLSNGKVEKRIPKYLTLPQSKKLLSDTIKSCNKYKIRNYAITCIFLNCCIRLNELILIDLKDIKLDEKTIKIHGKGNFERIIYLDDAVVEALNEYLKIRPKLSTKNKDYNALFLSNRNQRISRRNVQNIICSELKNSFNEDYKKFHTHSLRHTGATLLYNENDTDILIIKEILGHQSLKSTEVYTHVDNKKLKSLMEKFNILEIGGV